MDEALDLLKGASQDSENGIQTEWSCVYDLTDFSFDVYMDKDYEKAIHFK